MERAPWFTIVKRFGPASGPSWERYLRWSGLDRLREVVGLDASLCPPVLAELRAEDWKHNVHEDYRTHLFRDLPHLLGRVPDSETHNVLAVLESPHDEEVAAGPRGFTLMGFELLDVCGDISALTNCRGFPRSFSSLELNDVGLLDSLQRAYEVQQSLRREYPQEGHATCDVWAIWRRE